MRTVYHITGTSSGLGKSLAETALQDARTIVHGYARRAGITHENYFHHLIDLAEIIQLYRFVFPEPADADKIILINNAGQTGDIRYAGESAAEDIYQTYMVNAVAPHILMNTFIKKYSEHPAEKIIINITSGAASNPYDGWSSYCASKAALNMMSSCIAKEQELRNANIRIFAIAPGVLDTAMQDKLRNTDAHDFSSVGKFTSLHEKHQLADPGISARKIIDIINNPAQLTAVIHRLP